MYGPHIVTTHTRLSVCVESRDENAENTKWPWPLGALLQAPSSDRDVSVGRGEATQMETALEFFICNDAPSQHFMRSEGL